MRGASASERQAELRAEKGGGVKLWLLERNDRPSSYDVYMGFVVRAETRDEAISITNKESAHATWPSSDPVWPLRGKRANPELVDITELADTTGEPGLVLMDFKAG